MTLDQVKADLEHTNELITDIRETISRLTIKLRIMEEQKKALHALMVVLKELDGISEVPPGFVDTVQQVDAARGHA